VRSSPSHRRQRGADNGTWGGGGPNDWAAAAEIAGNAIGTVNPNWLIFVEDIGTYPGQSYWWGGNLMGVKDRPIVLNLPDKLVYSAHDYPDSVYPQPWFQGSDFPANLPAKFDQMWGYIYQEGIAPVYLGEFGTNLIDPKDAPWLKAITAYLSGDFNIDGASDIPAGHQGISWTTVTSVDFHPDGTANPPRPSDITITGGLIEIRSGESAGRISFTGGGTLQLDDSVHFTGKISGFTIPDQLDLRDISFGAGTTLNFAEFEDNTQGTLTVSDGAHVAQIVMAGQYVTGQFKGASDGHGGIVITDLPLTAGGTNLIGTGGVASSAAIAPQPAAITVPDGNTTVPVQSAPDVFDFSNLSFGNDTIAGFDPTQDALRLNHTQVNSLTVVRNDMFATAGGMLIALDATHSITLNGVAPASLTAANVTSV
jgi:hypothetical protein